MGNLHGTGNGKMKKWELKREWEMKLLIEGWGSSQLLFPFFVLLFPAARFGNIRPFQARNLNQKPLGNLSNNDGDGYENVT